MTPGTRIRVVAGPWARRIGSTGVVVGEVGTTYPWAGLGDHETVILLDNDEVETANPHAGWTCVINTAHLEPE